MPGRVPLFAMDASRSATRSSPVRDCHRRGPAGDGSGENPDGLVISLYPDTPCEGNAKVGGDSEKCDDAATRNAPDASKGTIAPQT